MPFVTDICFVLQTYQAKLQLALNKLCYMPSAPTHHLILIPAPLTIQYSLTEYSIPPIIGCFEQFHNILRIFVKMSALRGLELGPLQWELHALTTVPRWGSICGLLTGTANQYQTYRVSLHWRLVSLQLCHTFPIFNLPYSEFLFWPQAMDLIHSSFTSSTG